jgi:hypothetical protein
MIRLDPFLTEIQVEPIADLPQNIVEELNPVVCLKQLIDDVCVFLFELLVAIYLVEP